MNEILVFSKIRCEGLESSEKYCVCLKPHLSNTNKKKLENDSYSYIAEGFSKTFEVSLTEILLDTSFLQFQLNDSPYFEDILGNVTNECSVKKLKKRIASECSEKSLYHLGKKIDSKISIENIVLKLQSKVNSRELSNDKQCILSEVDGEVMKFDSLIENINYFFLSMKDNLLKSNNIKEAIELSIKTSKSQKDIKKFKQYKKLLRVIKENQKINSLLTANSNEVFKSLGERNGLKGFLSSEKMSNDYAAHIAKGCKKTYDAYIKTMCQDMSQEIYDYPKTQLAHDGKSSIGHESSIHLSCLNENFKKKNSKKISEDMRLISEYFTKKNNGSDIKNLDLVLKKNYNDNTKKVKDALCKNLPDNSLKAKKQIKEIDQKITTICNENLLSEECIYLKKYRDKLSFNIEKEKAVKKNKSFAKFRRENPFSKIKTEKEFIEKMGKRSVAKMAFFGKVKEVEKDVVKGAQIDAVAEELEKTDDTTFQKSVGFKKVPARKTSISKVVQNDFIPTPKGLKFSYSKKRESRYKDELRKIEKQIAEEEKRKKDLLDQYKNSSVDEQEQIDNQFDKFDNFFDPPSVPMSYNNVDDFIKEQYRIDSGIQKTPSVRKIASDSISRPFDTIKDPYRDTINKEVLTSDRIDVVDNVINSGEKINAFNLDLSEDGYKIQKLIFSGAIEKDLSLVYDKNPKKSIVDKISRSSYEQNEQVKKYKKLLKSKKDFLISKNSELEIEVIVQYSNSKKEHVVKPFIGSLNDPFYLENKSKYQKLKLEVETSIKEGDFETLSKIAS